MGWIDNMKYLTEGGLEVAREIDNMKHWTDGGLEVAREIDNMKQWTDGGLEVAKEIDNIKLWTDGGLGLASALYVGNWATPPFNFIVLFVFGCNMLRHSTVAW